MSAAVREPNSSSGRAAGARPRICFVGLNNLAVLAPEYDASGVAGEPLQQTLLATAMSRHGYDVRMVVADHGQPDGASWEGVTTYKAFAKKAGLPIVRFVHPRWTGLWSALKRADADVYYASCAGAMAGQIAMFCSRHARRFVFRIASDADCMPDALIIKHWYWRDKWMYQRALRRADGILVQSARQQELLLRNFGAHSSIAPLIIDAGRSDIAFAERDIDALWVGNLRPVKRPDVLLDVAESLPGLRFHMVGGPLPRAPELFETSRTRAASLGVRFHGAVAYRETSAMYGRARVFVNTSDVEGFPNTYLQAWASGTPVVAFFDPDGVIAREGLGMAVKTPGEMSAAVQLLSREEGQWGTVHARCLAFIERHYGEAAVLQPYLRSLDPSATSV
ncbi:MAG TPA: glycosyltransferase family 4 protein [Steroidobacteraceae bacterium]|nr:glycosyltransferase family 4 protein [Steroidobacteraceae bacterium]